MIGFAEKKDIPDMMKFIDEHWKKGHILAKNKEEFIYEYTNEDIVNMVISKDEDGNINGLEGFIPYGKSNRDIMLALWKVKKTENPMLGLEILQFIQKNADAKRISCLGINDRAMEIYRHMGFLTGKMTHWYRLNPQSVYEIAQINDSVIPAVKTESRYRLLAFHSFEELYCAFDFESYHAKNAKPLKEAWYIEKRYFNHPIYQYMVYGIAEEKEKAKAILIFRLQKYGKSQVLRCVDIIGEYSYFYYVTKEIDSIMKSFAAEYVDFYEAGMSEDDMESAGYRKVEGSSNIIPNYFSPFVRKNVDISYMTTDKDIVLFKADGDQDRPN